MATESNPTRFQTAHIVAEVTVVGGVILYFNSRLKSLERKMDAVSHQLDAHAEALESISMLLRRNGPMPPPRRSVVVRQRPRRRSDAVRYDSEASDDEEESSLPPPPPPNPMMGLMQMVAPVMSALVSPDPPPSRPVIETVEEEPVSDSELADELGELEDEEKEKKADDHEDVAEQASRVKEEDDKTKKS